MAYIRYDPNDPGDRARAYGNAFLGYILFAGGLGSIIYYIYSLVALFKGNYSENLWYSLGLLTLMAIYGFFVFFANIMDGTKLEAAKRYFLFYVGGTLDVSAIIGIIVAIGLLTHEGEGTGLLICSILVVLVVTLAVIVLYRKIEGYGPISIKWFGDKDVVSEISKETIRPTDFSIPKPVVQNISEMSYIYCHKCGKKLPDDSGFCSSCGTKLK